MSVSYNTPLYTSIVSAIVLLLYCCVTVPVALSAASILNLTATNLTQFLFVLNLSIWCIVCGVVSLYCTPLYLDWFISFVLCTVPPVYSALT